MRNHYTSFLFFFLPFSSDQFIELTLFNYGSLPLSSLQSTKRHYSAGLSEREREEEEARAHYEMQVESYRQRVQKYVEIAISVSGQPRPDVTEAMILIERDWKHDGFSDDEDAPTHEWEVNDPEVFDLEPDRREWESMESSR